MLIVVLNIVDVGGTMVVMGLFVVAMVLCVVVMATVASVVSGGIVLQYMHVHEYSLQNTRMILGTFISE